MFKVDQIDHAEVTVPDRFAAADWYQRVLGMEPVAEYERWAADANGPLMMRTAAAGTKIAFFEGTPEGSKRNVGFHRLAFRVSGQSFLGFVANLATLELKDSQGQSVTPTDVKDHELAFSLYFCDPWANALEITTYEHEIVRKTP